MARTSRLALLLLAALALAADARAVTWTFSGVIISVDPEVAAVDPTIMVGSPFSGSLLYRAPDDADLGTEVSEYFFEAPGKFALNITLGGSTISSLLTFLDGGIQVHDDSSECGGEVQNAVPECAPPYDAVFVWDHRAMLSSGGPAFQLADNPDIVLYDATGTALSDTSLPGALDLANFTLARLFIDVNDLGADGGEIFGDITSLVVDAPEPGAALLVAPGLALVVARSTRRGANR
jgi:hypothetical protein